MLKSITKVLSLYMIFPLISSILGFLILPIKSQFLSPKDYGVIGLLESIVVLLNICMSLQLNSGVCRIYYDIPEDEKQPYLGSIFVFLLTVGVIVIVLACAAFYLLSDIFFKDGQLVFFPYIFMQLIIVLLLQFSKIPDLYFFVNQKAQLTGLLSLSTFLFTNGFALFFIIVFHLGAQGILLAGIINGLIHLPIYLYITFRYTKPCLNRKYLKDTLIYSLPFIPATLGTLIYNYSDRYLLQHLMNIEVTGIYTFSNVLIIPFNILMSSLEYAFTSNYYKYRTAKIEQATLVRTKNLLSVIIGLVIIGWVYFLNEIKMFFNSQYAISFTLMALMAIFSFIRLLTYFPSMVLLYHKKTKYLPLFTFIPAILNIVLNIVFIPLFGLFGAVLTSIVCSFITLLLTHIVAFFVEKGNFDYGRLVLLLLLVALLCVINNFLISVSPFITIISKAVLLLSYLIICAFLFRFSFLNILKEGFAFLFRKRSASSSI